MEKYIKGIYPTARNIKAEKHDLAAVTAVRGADMKVRQIGNISGDRENFKNPQSGRVYGSDGLSPTLNTCQGGQREPKIIVAMSDTLQAQNDDPLPEKRAQYRIRKLTPKECWRLMDFSDADFEKAEKVNSDTQLYKQAGNSIAKNVLMALFKQILADSDPGREREA